MNPAEETVVEAFKRGIELAFLEESRSSVDTEALGRMALMRALASARGDEETERRIDADIAAWVALDEHHRAMVEKRTFYVVFEALCSFIVAMVRTA